MRSRPPGAGPTRMPSSAARALRRWRAPWNPVRARTASAPASRICRAAARSCSAAVQPAAPAALAGPAAPSGTSRHQRISSLGTARETSTSRAEGAALRASAVSASPSRSSLSGKAVVSGTEARAAVGCRGPRWGPPAVASGRTAAAVPAVPVEQGAEDRGVDAGGVGDVPGGWQGGGPVGHGLAGVWSRARRDRAVGGLVHRPVHQGLPPAPTRVMISQSARSSNMRVVGIRTVVLCRPVTAWPARSVQ